MSNTALSFKEKLLNFSININKKHLYANLNEGWHLFSSNFKMLHLTFLEYLQKPL